MKKSFNVLSIIVLILTILHIIYWNIRYVCKTFTCFWENCGQIGMYGLLFALLLYIVGKINKNK